MCRVGSEPAAGESNQRDILHHTTAVVFTASPQTSDTNQSVCVGISVYDYNENAFSSLSSETPKEELLQHVSSESTNKQPS